LKRRRVHRRRAHSRRRNDADACVRGHPRVAVHEVSARRRGGRSLLGRAGPFFPLFAR
jgi:hypothetical protein